MPEPRKVTARASELGLAPAAPPPRTVRPRLVATRVAATTPKTLRRAAGPQEPRAVEAAYPPGWLPEVRERRTLANAPVPANTPPANAVQTEGAVPALGSAEEAYPSAWLAGEPTAGRVVVVG